MIPLGWVAGRSNVHTVTLMRRFKDEAEAVRAGRSLPPEWVWAIEDVPRP